MCIERAWACFGLFGVGGGGHPPRPAHIPPKVTAAKWPNLRVSIRPPQPKTNFWRKSTVCAGSVMPIERVWVCFSLFPASISELRWTPASKAGSICVVNSGKAPGQIGQNFSVCRCRPKWPARSSITGLRCRLSAAQQKPSSIRLGPWPPRFPGPLGHPPRASPSLVQVWRHFGLFFSHWGVPAPKGQSKGFPRSGRIRGGMGPGRCGSGAPNQPLEWPHSRFGRARYFFF